VNRWLSVRLEMMGVGVVFGTAMVVTIFPTNAGLAGLALTSALNLTGGPPITRILPPPLCVGTAVWVEGGTSTTSGGGILPATYAT